MPAVAELEAQLDHPELAERQEALRALIAEPGDSLPPVRDWVNLHCHSWYSYNGYGASPTRLVWEAKKRGLWAVGLVDFDVLDGVDEFHAAGRIAGIRTTAGVETRVFIPEFADREMSSPGEPGVTYHMGNGFISSTPDDTGAAAVLDDLRKRARDRNLVVVAAVNAFLAPVELDYEGDVVPLTPKGVATERHLCAAYQAKAESVFADAAERAAYWQDKLGQDVSAILDDPAKLQALIRAKTMKAGGVGYQQPDENSFPLMTTMNGMSKALGGLPTLTWLDGTRPGEAAIDEYMDLQAADGVCALNIIPDRNWNIADAETKALKIAKLEEIVAKADARGWPIQVGTELNAPGLKWVDDFDAPELANVVASFRRGARIIYGHHVARAQGEVGYAADDRFDSVAAKNDHYAQLAEDHAVLPG